MNALMQDLGFGDGYVVQGGDIGSKVARVIAAEHTSCIAAHRKSPTLPSPISQMRISEKSILILKLKISL